MSLKKSSCEPVRMTLQSFHLRLDDFLPPSPVSSAEPRRVVDRQHQVLTLNVEKDEPFLLRIPYLVNLSD